MAALADFARRITGKVRQCAVAEGIGDCACVWPLLLPLHWLPQLLCRLPRWRCDGDFWLFVS